MPITPLSGSGGIDEVWGDQSGGEIVFSFIHPSYTSTHILRVVPFDTAGTGLYTPSITGVVTGLQQEADNIATLIAALYAADTTIAAVAVNQTLVDHSGQAPYAFSFASSSTVVGSAGGTSQPVPNVLELVSRGGDGSRWRITLPGCSSVVMNDQASKEPASASSGAPHALALYLTGQANGGVHAAKTGVVTHNGVPVLLGPANYIQAMNKRLRRHFKVV